MPKGRFYHVYISQKEGITQDEVEEKLNHALDWYRYNIGLYVVFSTSDMKTWMSRLKDFVEPDGNLFICELDVSNRNGWMNKDFWEWLKKPRS